MANGSTFSNELATAADISESSLEDLVTQIMGAVDDQDNNISLMPKALVVPRQLIFEATRILKSTLQPGQANNDLNALRARNAIPDGIVLNHYLTDADAFFITTNCPMGLLTVQRDALEFKRDNDFHTENALAFARERYSCGWVNPRAVFGSPGA
jgi:hypothetical protein